MNKLKGQVSIEYLILTGFIVLAIIVPSIIFLYSVTNNSVHGKITNQKAVDLGKGIVNDAKQVYYLGLYSNKVVEYEIPRNAQNVYIVELEKDNKIYYYFGITLSNGKETAEYKFQSDVPLTSDKTLSFVTDNAPDPNPVQECSESTCKFHSFEEPISNPGKKRFKIETIYEDNEIRSAIIPIID